MKLPSGLVLPRGAGPKFRCEVCGEGFYEEQPWMRHVKRCLKKNSDAIEKMVEMNRARDPLRHAIDQEALDFQLKKYGSG